MKKRYVVAIIVALAMCGIIIGFLCSRNLTGKGAIVRLYQRNEDIFLQAAATGDYSAVERIISVRDVDMMDTYVAISCGGSGLGAGTNYYGIFYYEGEDLCAVDVDASGGRFVESDDGYLYHEENGDNRFYVEPLGNHYFYYEAHF